MNQNYSTHSMFIIFVTYIPKKLVDDHHSLNCYLLFMSEIRRNYPGQTLCWSVEIWEYYNVNVGWDT